MMEESLRKDRPLSEKGEALYFETVSKFSNKLKVAWSKIEQAVTDFRSDLDQEGINLASLSAAIKQHFTKFELCIQEFSAYLKGVRSADSEIELERLNAYAAEKCNQYKFYMKVVELKQPVSADAGEVDSASQCLSKANSRGSAKSDVSITAVKKRAKAESAKTKLQYVKKQAEIEASLMIIKQEQQAAALETEAQILESYNALTVSNMSNKGTSPPLKDPIDHHTQSEYPLSIQNVSKLPLTSPTKMKESVKHYVDQQSTLNVHAQEFVPQTPNMTDFNEIPPNNAPNDIGFGCFASDFTKYLWKKDLIIQSLTKFNDRPESFPCWRTSFKSVVKDLGVTPTEELDLLVKYLGIESSKQVLSIKIAHSSQPEVGLRNAWQRLNDRYGSPEMIEVALKSKLERFPKLSNKDSAKLYDLYDILSEIESVKKDRHYGALLAYYDSSSVVKPIVEKLPYNLQEKWTTRAAKYKEDHKVAFPSFSYFVAFVKEMCKVRNDPSFTTTVSESKSVRQSVGASSTFGKKTLVSANKTGIETFESQIPVDSKLDLNRYCLFHKSSRHSLNKCKGFRSQSISERRRFLKQNQICFKCCKSAEHKFFQCTSVVKCSVCDSDKHPSALHVDFKLSNSESAQGGELRAQSSNMSSSGESKSSNVGAAEGVLQGAAEVKVAHGGNLNSACTEICTPNFSGKSCAKLIPVDIFHKDNPSNVLQIYAILDEQSNRTLARPELFDQLDLSREYLRYTLTSCSGMSEIKGRQSDGCVLRSVTDDTEIHLGNIIECQSIPDIRDEIPTKDIARFYPHLNSIIDFIPEIDNQREILLLLGRDVPQVHHIMDQRIGPYMNSPYAQRTKLGWVIVGETCLDKVHNTNNVVVNKTVVLDATQDSVYKQCESSFKVRDTPQNIGDNIFVKTRQDEVPGPSVEDREFMKIMSTEFVKTASGNWIAPLPFRSSRPRLPNNKSQALRRALLLDRSIRKNSLKKEHILTFMDAIFKNNHASIAPPISCDSERWYLPVFGVYHPKKPDKIRCVFDSSAKFKGTSLNDVLITGPNLTNNLLGILLRYRKESIAVMCDIQQMFYNFLVKEEHRDFLRFLWYKDNDVDNPLVEYRMNVHVFGNSPSPAIASFGLRKTAELTAPEFGMDVKDFVINNFYVDDGLISLPDVAQATSLIKRTQAALNTCALRLCKIASNSTDVMKAFPEEDLAKGLQNLGSDSDNHELQHSLGLLWDNNKDNFTFRVSEVCRPFTRRGVLATVNSLFDPIGLVSPVTINGKILLRDMISETSDWDERIDDAKLQKWEIWCNSLKLLENLEIPRTYAPCSISGCESKELHIFSDASQEAIAAAAYIAVQTQDTTRYVNLVLGKARVAPKSGHSMPRLELCAAVLACDVKDIVVDNFGEKFDKIRFYTDSRVVLGYINNQKRRFYVYVSNRIERIHRSSTPAQWSYISTDKNPADSATRWSTNLDKDVEKWLKGPSFLLKPVEMSGEEFPLIHPEKDIELKQDIDVLKTSLTDSTFVISHYCEKFSSWNRLVSAIGQLRRFVKAFKSGDKSLFGSALTVIERQETEVFLLRATQNEVYRKEMDTLNNGQDVSVRSSIAPLNPFMDETRIMRVGGRLSRSSLIFEQKHSIIVPRKHHVALLLVRYFHDKIKHQGRSFTEGSIRSGGIWIIGCKRLINSVISRCVKCRKLRGKTVTQIMSDLPSDRLTSSPAFTCVGVDVFGPWSIITRKTRGGVINNKRWAIIFSCMSSRAIHIEVIENMSSDAFINALRRFYSIRGPVKQFRSDCGTNFIGATEGLNIEAINVETGPVKNVLNSKNTTWVFHAPHSSHMGGSWERMIGVTRRILDHTLADVLANNLTHDVLITLMAEVVSIVNARPLVPVSSDPESSEVLSPNMLLTQKSELLISPPIQSRNLKSQWQQVQALADLFWKKWRSEFLQQLQQRRKWINKEVNIAIGDLVLLKDKQLWRGDWSIGVVKTVFPSVDGNIRKVLVSIMKNGDRLDYIRPITELVLLLRDDTSVL